MFYCVWTPDGVADEVSFDTLVRALRSTSDVLSATGEYWPEAKRSRDVLERISTTTMQRFTRKLNNAAQSDRGGPSSAQASIDTPSAPGLERSSLDMADADLTSQTLLGPQFETENSGLGTFPPFYSDQADSFTSADMLEYFMGSGGNVNMTDGGIFRDGYPSMDEIMSTFFEDELRDFEPSL
jgi:hypothetical protein